MEPDGCHTYSESQMVWRGRKRGLSEITYHFTGRNSTVWSESSWNHKASAASNAIVKPGLPIVWFYRNKTDVAGNEQSLCNSKTSPIIRNIRCSYWFQWECSLKKLSTCWSTYECYLILYPVSSKCMYVCMTKKDSFLPWYLNMCSGPPRLLLCWQHYKMKPTYRNSINCFHIKVSHLSFGYLNQLF